MIKEPGYTVTRRGKIRRKIRRSEEGKEEGTIRPSRPLSTFSALSTPSTPTTFSNVIVEKPR